ncbi:MAG: response regulator, partial [Propionicimonas sp.]
MSEAYASPPRILVIDDDEALAEMLDIVLRSEGFHARLCHLGDTALDTFRDYRPDLVLLDLML